MEQKFKDPNMSTSNFSHLIVDKKTKNTYWKKENKSSLQIVLRKLDDHKQKNEIRPIFLSPCMKTLSASKTKPEIPNSETTRRKHRQGPT